MCKVSAETVRIANERTMARFRSGRIVPTENFTDGITVKVIHNGRVYSKHITHKQIKAAYESALKAHVKTI